MHWPCASFIMICLTLMHWPAGAEAAAPFDMEAPAPAEAGLLEAPVQALEDRLQQLLADWPEHPILSQLATLCQRLTGAIARGHTH